MAALAIMMLGSSQDSATLPLVGLLVAFGALFFTDLLGWFSLHPYIASAAGVVAGANALIQAQVGGGTDSQFLAVANLLIHLQIILLFQKKEQRIYWQLITLSLLQVVVAAALNLFVLFGPLLVLYTGFAVAAMLLFFHYRQAETYLNPTEQIVTNSDKTVSISTLQPVSGNEFRNSTARSRQGRPRLLKRSLFKDFCLIGLSTVVVSAGVFLFMPRFGNDVWRAKTKSATGFSDEDVNLDSVSSIYEDPTIVMRVSFFREGTNEPYPLSCFPYFRGTVREIYRRGKWSRRRSYREPDAEFRADLKPPTRMYSAVRQKINFETAGGDTVFTIAPPCGLNDVSESIRMCPETLEVKHFSHPDEDPVELSIGTLGLRNGLQSEFVPNYDSAKSMTMDDSWNVDRMLNVTKRLPDLTAKAAEIVKDIPKDDVLRRARALERHFTDGKVGYQYSLDPSPNRKPNVWPDPVEDFVMNHKEGHCQFFASALTLMLRSQGIPARYVSGFRAESYNVVGGYYQLRAMDAHAWVEVAVPADQLPRDEIMPTEGMDGVDGDAEQPLRGAWVRLDPTPSGDFVGQSVAVSPWRQQLSDSMDYLQLLWSEYVLGLNEKRQRKAIYEPILNAIKNTYAMAFSREVWTERLEALRARFEGDFFTRENMRDSGLAIVLLTAAFYLLRFLTRLLWSWGRRYWTSGRRKRQPVVEFYRRLEKILAKHGIERDEGQTPSEFAVDAGAKLSSRLTGQKSDSSAVAEIPKQVVDLFYRVRFGDERLDTVDLQQLENWLGKLQKSLAAH
jgi:hypothetical protein